MYAITSTGYRAIASAVDAVAGETVVADLPDWLVSEIASAEARAQRDAALRSCDWTQVGDAPLTAEQRTAWSTYRQALRDLPAQPGFPQSIEWPKPPGSAP